MAGGGVAVEGGAQRGVAEGLHHDRCLVGVMQPSDKRY